MIEPAHIFAEEVGLWISTFVETKTCSDGRWSAWLTPDHSFLRNGDFPPGQCNTVGDHGWIVENQYAPEWKSANTFNGEVSREEYAAAWAARPFFYSHAAAQGHMERWIRENRPDIVRECEGQARQALAYRANKARKAAHA